MHKAHHAAPSVTAPATHAREALEPCCSTCRRGMPGMLGACALPDRCPCHKESRRARMRALNSRTNE